MPLEVQTKCALWRLQPQNLMATNSINGTSGNDSIVGTSGDDLIAGGTVNTGDNLVAAVTATDGALTTPADLNKVAVFV